MKYNFKQIFALGTSVLLVGMTMGMVGGANYPNPFVVGGSANVAVVYGTGADVSVLDSIEAGRIETNLAGFVTGTTGTATGTGGDFKSLASGSDLLYLNDELGENLQTLTSTELGTVLADATFVDDGGTNYDYEQTIAIGSSSDYNKFEFGNSDNDFDDPALMLDFEESTGKEIYNLTVTFSKAVNFTSANSEGEEIEFFGKTYTVGTATDDNTLILLGGADSTRINVGETATMTVDGTPYTVSLDGLSSDTATKAGITVNDVYKSLTEGQTKTFVMSDGTEISVYAKTVFRTGDAGTGYVQVELGSDKLTLEHGTNAQVGADNDDIDGTRIFMTPPGSTGMQALTKMVISIVAEDNDLNHVLVGDSFVDPLFGTIEIQFNEVVNGPVFEDEEDTGAGRTAFELTSGGDRELEIVLTDKNGYTKTVPFTYRDELRDSNSDTIKVVEGQAMVQDDYFILNSGNYEHFMQVTKISLDADNVSDDDITFKDIITGTQYTIVDKNLGWLNQSTTVTINSQVYTINSINTTAINVTSSDFSLVADADGYVAVFPYIELISGEDYPRVALTDDIAIGHTLIDVSNATRTKGAIYELPTGNVQFRINDSQIEGPDFAHSVEYRVDETAGTWTNITTLHAIGAQSEVISFAVGKAVYSFDLAVVDVTIANLTITSIAIDTGFTADADDNLDAQDSPGILFVENKDKSDSEVRNVIFINTTDDNAYSEYYSVAFSSTQNTGYDEQAWDETKLTGYLTNWGTYVLKDQTDSNQYVMRLTYPDAQMYANVYFAEVGASISVTAGGALGDVLVTDDEVSSVSSKNLIVIGGSCINSVAAYLVGGAFCGAGWTDETEVGSGQFLIESFGDAYATGKIALLVAGYDVADTVNAATFLRTQTVDTTAGNKYVGTTATQATLQVE